MLHPSIQRQLWRMQWTELRPLQVKAIKQVLQTDQNIILSAATASGKTEAAFLPILSSIADELEGSIRVMYVGPLKALINDQFQRIEDLCQYLEAPVFRWHGDVGASHKTRLISKPGGVLLITPESLESLFVNRSEYLKKIFHGLRFVVIDELHSFLENERGTHLKSLLSRLCNVVHGNSFRTVALSATIGDSQTAKEFISTDCPNRVQYLVEDSESQEIRYRIHGYLAPSFKKDTPENQKVAEEHRRAIAEDIAKHCHGQSNLVFANSRADVEELADLTKQVGHSQRLTDLFMVHHGSLSRLIREDTEKVMQSDRPATTFCSSTLEMGIDIGNVRMVGQIGSSWSVSSQLQRLGRSGRHQDQPRIMRVYLDCPEPNESDDVLDRLHLSLIQAIAISELMIQKWIEPPLRPKCDLSTLIQQVISMIAQTGGLKANAIFEQLCSRGPFRDITASMFTMLLKELGSRDVIEQMAEGDLILGLKGEQIRRDRGFYAAFATAEEYAIIHDSQQLGSLEIAPNQNEHILFAGKRWLVTEVSEERHEIYVVPAKGWRRPKFSGGAGVVHPRIRQEMKEVLLSEKQYSYLDEKAANILNMARQSARQSGACSKTFLKLGEHQTALMTWTGTRLQDTLAAMFRFGGIVPEITPIALIFRLPEQRLKNAIVSLAQSPPTGMEIACHIQPRLLRKYDWLLSDYMLNTQIAQSRLELEGALEFINELGRINIASATGVRRTPRLGFCS